MFRHPQRWFFTLLALLALVILGCSSGGGGGTDDLTTPDDPFVPNDPGGQIPRAPSRVDAATGNRTINITVTPVPGVDGYFVYLSEGDGTTFVRFNNTPYTTTNISIGGLSNGTTYFVGVTAVRNNRESATTYVDNAPAAAPLVPGPPPPDPDPISPVKKVTVWSTTNVPAAVTIPPNDRRILVSWNTIPTNIDHFIVDFILAQRGGAGDAQQPDSSLDEVILLRRDNVALGAIAELSDTAPFQDPRDPAAVQIAPLDAVPGSQVRSEAVMEFPAGNNILLNIAEALGEFSVEGALEALADYGYSAADLGITRNPNGSYTVDTDALDGIDHIGVAVRITPVNTAGLELVAAWGAGFYNDFPPLKVEDIVLTFVANPNLEEDPDASPLPRLTWRRLRFPMGSDIVDYGIIRDGGEGRFTFRLTEVEDGAEEEIFEEVGGVTRLKNVLDFTDDEIPSVRKFGVYNYSLFGIDRAGNFGTPSDPVRAQPGGEPTDPPVVIVEITQGAQDIVPGGDDVIGGNGVVITVDFTDSTAAEGQTVVEYRVRVGNGTPIIENDSTIVIPAPGCPPGNVPINTTISVQVVDDAGGESEIETFDVTIVSDATCPA